MKARGPFMRSTLAHGLIILPVAIAIACGGATTDDGSAATRAAGSGQDGASSSSGGSSTATSSDGSADACPPNPVLRDAAPGPYRSPDGGGAYPYCEAIVPDGWVTFCQPSVSGHGFSIWHTEASGAARLCNGEVCGTMATDCNTCLCYVGCSEQTECPQPVSGTATAQCLGPPNTMKSCIMPCDGGEQCPDGMKCVDTPDLNRKTCAWVRGQ